MYPDAKFPDFVEDAEILANPYLHKTNSSCLHSIGKNVFRLKPGHQLTYKNGKLFSGVTRGNGTIGEVVTQNVKQFKNIPLTIPYNLTPYFNLLN